MVKVHGVAGMSRKCHFRTLALICVWVSSVLAGEVTVHAAPSIDSLTSTLFMPTLANSITDKGKKSASSRTPPLFTPDQLLLFDRDGFLIVSDLLLDEMKDLISAGDAFVRASKKMNAYFSTIEMGMIFQAGMMVANDTITSDFRRVALDSILPQAVAELMRLSKDSNIRVLRYVEYRKRRMMPFANTLSSHFGLFNSSLPVTFLYRKQ